MRWLLILVVLFCGGCAGYFDSWSRGDVEREVLWLGLDVVDWGQSRRAAGEPDRYVENNPVLGRHPSEGRVDLYFLTTALVHVGVVEVLPSKWRPWFQWVTIGMSGLCVGRNLSIGLGWGW